VKEGLANIQAGGAPAARQWEIGQWSVMQFVTRNIRRVGD
jgi:hypothetical protein